MGDFIDLAGQRFGKLVVISRAGYIGKDIGWECVCDCGKHVRIRGQSLRSGKTRSCGCLQRQLAADAHTIHGGRKTRLYITWQNMNRRCSEPTFSSYPNYGGRGIKVCPEWENSFEAFQQWALANGYRDDLTIDRKDANGNYEPENCRWATRQEQANNRRSNHWIERDGQRKTVEAWGEDTGIPAKTIHKRLKLGWSAEKALTTPVKK